MEYRAQHHGGTLRLMTNHPPGLDEGEIVIVSIERARSPATHRHQFAWIKDAWASLPEAVMFEDWAQTPETLRKRALIETGYYEQVVIDCEGATVAKAVGRELRNAKREAHGYAVAAVRGNMAVVRWPESQSMRAMGGDRFRESKSAILDWIAAQIGVAPEELTRNAA